MALNLEKLTLFSNNKWFKFSRYLISGLLILGSIFVLTTAWYGRSKLEGDIDMWKDVEGWRQTHLITDSIMYHGQISNAYYQCSMVFGFVSLVWAIMTLSIRKLPLGIIVVPIAFVLLIVVVTLGALSIHDTDHHAIYGLIQGAV